MDRINYLNDQIKRLDAAIASGERALLSAKTIHELYFNTNNTSSDKAADHEVDTQNIQDTLMYFDANDIQGQFEMMKLQLRDFKRHMASVKIVNDEFLVEGGFLKIIDDTIQEIFLSTKFCKLDPHDEIASINIQASIDKLEELKAELAAMLSSIEM